MAPFCLHLCVGYINEFAVILCWQLFLSCSEESTMKYIHSEVSQQVYLNGSFQDFLFSLLFSAGHSHILWHIVSSLQWKPHNSLYPPPLPFHIFFPWESDVNRPQPCQVQSSLIPCMLRHLEQSKSCRPSCFWKHQLCRGETVASCLQARGSSGIVLYSWRAADSLNLTSCLPSVPHCCRAWAEKRNPVFSESMSFHCLLLSPFWRIHLMLTR